VLVLPADVPFVTVRISTTFAPGPLHTTVVLAPDRNNDGTNALLVNPPGFIPFAFGPGSFHRHAQLAEEVNATVQIYHSDI